MAQQKSRKPLREPLRLEIGRDWYSGDWWGWGPEDKQHKRVPRRFEILKVARNTKDLFQAVVNIAICLRGQGR